MLKKHVAAAAFAAMLALGGALPAFADEATAPSVGGQGTQESPLSLSVVKRLTLAEGIAVPEATVEFTIEAVTADAPKASVGSIEFNRNDNVGDLKDGNIYVISKNATVSFEAFPHAGVYEYTVAETSGSVAGMTYATNTYAVRVYVANATDGSLFIKNVTAQNNDKSKASEIAFDNTYTKNASLVLSKTTVGDLADKTRDFNFEITFTKATTSGDNTFEGRIGDKSVTCKAGEAASFQLHDGESLEFSNLPAGTRYVVTEVAAEDGYAPSVKVIENGVEETGRSAADDEGLSSSETGTNLVGEGANSVAFTNTQVDVPLTGVLVNNAPFAIAVVLGAFALLALGARRVMRSVRR